LAALELSEDVPGHRIAEQPDHHPAVGGEIRKTVPPMLINDPAIAL
jgi:hypothetical protein